MHTIINLSITNQSVTSIIIYKLYDAYELRKYIYTYNTYLISPQKYCNSNIVFMYITIRNNKE